MCGCKNLTFNFDSYLKSKYHHISSYFSQMIQVVILGTGNVATHLINAFENASNVEVVEVFNRNSAGFDNLPFKGRTTTEISNLMNADCYLIAVPDDAVQELSAFLPFENRLVIHTSGSVFIHELDAKNRRGVFYPLQTFSKEREVDFSEIPVCIEAEHESDLKIRSEEHT